MWKLICALLILVHCCSAGPLAQQKKHLPNRVREDSVAAMQTQESADAETEMQEAGAAEAQTAPLISSTLTLPSNATSIRADITDNFSCANKSYGYYADVENDCQIFHVCLPVTYADGKENTFRWSFICPEETIFSQESFTCMRREDMTIECEESYRYYELNGNFGQTMEEEQESSNLQPAQVMASEPAEAMESEPAAAAAAEPVQEPAKPVKVQKPKPKPMRHKPAVTYNKPQRKSPVPSVPAPVVEAIEEPEPETESLAITLVAPKPLKPHRFSVRPNKERPQALKPAVVAPTRNEIFNSIRKRPAVFNRKPVQETEVTPTEAILQAPVELSEPKPTLKLQTLFVESTPEAVAAEEPAAEASEAAVVLALPETVADAQPEPETVPMVESQIVVDQAKPEATAELAEKQVEEMKPIEAIEEIPAVILETLAESPKELEETPQQQESPAEPEQEKAEEPTPAESYIEPAIVEVASNEEASNNIEELEAAKPADAPESLPATPEMEQPSPLVEQMLDKTETQQSLGGFKPVDPVMAAEAEQLISDFLNTLRKQEEKTETDMAPAVAMEMAETSELETKPEAVEPQQEEIKDEAVSIEEAKLPEPEIIDKNASVEEQLLEVERKPQMKLRDSPIINIKPLNYQIPVQVSVVPEPEPELEEKQPEAVKEPESQAVAEQEQTKPVEAVSQEESLPAAVHMPAISIDDIVELVKERLDQNPKTEQLTPMELVLTPGAAAPMSLIQSESKPETEMEMEAEPAAAAAPVAMQESEDIIMPIYQRIANAEPSMSLVQTLPVTANKAEADEQPQAEQAAVSAISALLAVPAGFQTPEVPETKSNSRMDARKRRFLFRADAS